MANASYPVKRGEPRLVQPPCICFIKLRLYPGQDDELIAFLAGARVGDRFASRQAAASNA